MKRTILISILITMLLFLSVAYSKAQSGDDNSLSVTSIPPTPTVTPDEAEIIRPEGWSEETHSNEVKPNYEVVFPQDKVNQITITIDPENWAAMQANMTELYGERGARGQGVLGGGPPAPGQGGPNAAGVAPAGGNLIARLWAWVRSWWSAGNVAPAGGQQSQQPPFPGDGQPPQPGEPAAGSGLGRGPGGPGFDGGPGFGGRENPMWVPATIEFEGHTWTNVGVRYKGNSSLMSSWNSGSSKLPLKLDFDEFEDDFPEIKNQRFYGFKQLSLANGFGDNTYLRETITYDLLKEAGLPAAETAYYDVILDYGEGPVYLGLYTVIEVIDDTVVERYFGNDKGNIYEGDGRAVSLAEGTFDQIKDGFQKENNKTEADWSDIEELYQVLHSEERATNPKAWRAKLESIFDVDAFLEWLAISAAIQHWDTYGGMSHNFYLYHNPDTDQLVWISWDHNEILGGMGGGGRDNGGERRPGAPAMGENPAAPVAEEAPAGQQQQPAERMGPGGPRGGGPGGGRNVSLDKADVGDNWPLIRFLLDDPTYYERYLNYLEEAGNLLSSEALAAKYQTLAELIRPYVDNPNTFDNAVQSLMERTTEQAQAVTEFLANQ